VYGVRVGAMPSSPWVEGRRVDTVNADTILDDNYDIVLVDASGANRLITLPTAASAKFKRVICKKIDAVGNTVTLAANGAETIDGAANVVLSNQYEEVEVESNGTAWYIIGRYTASSAVGSLIYDGTGATVDALTVLFTHTEARGLGGMGSIKNTGGVNTLTIRRRVVDKFGNTTTQDDDVLPGAYFSWDVSETVGASGPPYTTFEVQVQSKVAGNSTNYEIHQLTFTG